MADNVHRSRVWVASRGASRELILEELGGFILLERVDDRSLGITDKQRAYISGMKREADDRRDSSFRIVLFPETRYTKWGSGLPIQVVGENIAWASGYNACWLV